MKTYLLVMALLLSAVAAEAQSVRADRFVFNTGPCVLRSGSGSPEGVVTGNPCDRWHRTDAPYLVYTKRSGVGTNTGWLLLASTDLTDTANLARLNTANAFSGLSAAIFLSVVNGGAGHAISGQSTGGAGVHATSSTGWDFYGAGPKSYFIGPVGIGTLAPLSALSINGGLHVGGDADAGDNNALIDGTLGVTGVSTLTGLVNANGGIAVDTTNFTVDGTTGAIATTALAALTTAAESWVGPSTTSGVYFKSGNVGMGTASPAVGKLEVRSSTNDEGLILVNSKASGTKYGIDIAVTGTGTANYGFYLDAVNATANYSLYTARGDAIFGGTSGRVGIGVGMTAPDNLFHVRSTAAGGVATMKLENSNADAAGDLFQIRKNSASPAAADTLGTIQFRGNDSTAVDTNFADIIGVADDVVDATEDGSLLFALVEAGTKATRVTMKGSMLGVGVTPTRRLHIGNSTLTQFIASQATPPTCSTNCGTSPAVTGSDTFMTVTMGTGGVPASGFVITFSGAWPSAPSCVASMAKAGMVVGKLPLTVVTTTTTITVVTNGTAPATTDKYHFHCGGPTG